MNEDLAEPVMRAVATHWEHVLVAQLARQLDQLEMACIAAVAAAGADIEAALTDGATVGASGAAVSGAGETGTGRTAAAGVAARLRGIKESAEQRVRAGLARAKAEARALVQSRQKELTRSITPQVGESHWFS